MVVVPMEKRDVYVRDLFGLKTLNEQHRLVRYESGLGHKANREEQGRPFFEEKVMKHLIKEKP